MKNLPIIKFLVLLFGLPTFLSSQAEIVHKTYQATRVSEDISIDLDGYLNEDAWSFSEVAGDFVQSEPVFKDPVSQKTEVRILYTDRGIYVGAMLYDTEPSKILKQLSPRDERNNTDWFGVIFDTYKDGLNGFAFNVTAAGVQQDVKVSGGNEDVAWDAIWESKVRFLDNGWSIEMFIPFLSLRFANTDIQEWNVNFLREVRRKRESLYWNPVNPAIEGFLNQAGHLQGIKNIKAPVRLSVTPFVTGYINTTSDPSSGAEVTVTPAYTGGMDLKYGINDAFTLDMTLVPDFGQTFSDNQVLNLSPFEVRFDENRQFFKEGTELFDKGNLFYSRRVGGTPVNFTRGFTERGSNEVLVSNPSQSQLFNATKVSGRTSRGTGLGIFNAVEGEEYAIFQDVSTGAERRVKTNPYTNYNVLVADQNLPNNSVVSLINTNVTRFGEDYDANVTGAFVSLKNKAQSYAVGGNISVANQFYENNTVTGHTFGVGAGKISGNWRGSIDYSEESDDYNPNDLGLLFSPNERIIQGNISYNDYKPKNDRLQRWEIGISPSYARLYKPNEFVNFGVGANGFMLWKSRNAVGFSARVEPFTSFDYFEPRSADFSRFYEFPTSWNVSSFFSSDYRKVFAFDVRGFYRNFGEEGRVFKTFTISPRVRVSDQFSFVVNSSITESDKENGWTNPSIAGEPIAGIDAGDVMYGTRDRVIFENSLTAQFIFNNKMSLSTRVRHYWDQVEYTKFSRLEQDGSLTDLAFTGGDSNGEGIYDVNFNFFTIDMNYTWRFTKGSDIIFVWKNNISGRDKDFESNYFSNFSNLFDRRQTNSFSLKVVYFLDYDSVVNG